jgi:hypothetical protein
MNALCGCAKVATRTLLYIQSCTRVMLVLANQVTWRAVKCSGSFIFFCANICRKQVAIIEGHLMGGDCLNVRKRVLMLACAFNLLWSIIGHSCDITIRVQVVM